MALINHTPGPWERTRYLNSNRLNFQIVSMADPGDPWQVAEASQWLGEREEQIEANANLIAAAPDILAALEDILSSRGKAWHPEDADVVRAKAAIAKARTYD